MTAPIAPVRWEHDRLILLDQRLLPGQELERAYARWEDVADAIRTLVVRGAPAIGVAAAFGVVLAARQQPRHDVRRRCWRDLEIALKGLAAHAAHRGQPLLGARPDAARAPRPRASGRSTEVRAAAAGRGAGDPRRGHRRQPRARRSRRHAGAAERAHPHALQRGRAGHRRLRHRARRRALGPRAGQGRAAVGGRDAAGDAGLAAHRVGVRARRHPAPADRRRRGRLGDGARRRSIWWSPAPTASPPTATPPTRSAPTRWPCSPRHHRRAVLRRRAVLDDRSGAGRRATADPDRGARRRSRSGASARRRPRRRPRPSSTPPSTSRRPR